MSGALKEAAPCPSLDEDLFPGCKFDINSNLISLFDPLVSDSSQIEKVNEIAPYDNDLSSLEDEQVKETNTVDEQHMDQVEDPSIDAVWGSNECLASSLDSNHFQQRLLEASEEDEVNTEVSSVASFTSLGIPYPAIGSLHAHSMMDTRASVSIPRTSFHSWLKSMSNPPSRINIAAALARWKAEKRQMMMQEQEAKTKKEEALKALAESTEKIFMTLQSKQKIKCHHNRRSSTLKSSKNAISNNLHALQLLVEQKKRRTMELNQLVKKKVLQKEKNMMTLRSRLEKEFQRNPDQIHKSIHLNTTSFKCPMSNQLASSTTRLPPLLHHETQIHQVLARAVATLSKLPAEIRQHLNEPQSNLSSPLSTRKPLPYPLPQKTMIVSSSSSSIIYPPHSSLQLSPSSLTLSRIKPSLSFTFTNTSDSILRVSILPLEMDLEDFLTLSSTPTLSLPKGISIASQICLNLDFLSHPLSDFTTQGLRLSVNGKIYAWPISILADQFKLDCSPKCIQFSSNEYQQRLSLSNKGTISDELELQCDESSLSISPCNLRLDPLKSRTILLEWHPKEEKNHNTNSMVEKESKKVNKTLSILSLQTKTTLLQIPLDFHISPSPLTLHPLETEFFYCPTNFQIKTEVTLKNNLKQGVRYQTKIILESHSELFQVKVKPATSVVQVDTPTSVQIQLRCISSELIDSPLKVTCQILFDVLKDNVYSFVLHGYFFNPDFLMSVNPLEWKAMSLNETYKHPFTITNPTPVMMELNMTYTCENAQIQFTPMNSESLVLAPGQTASGWLEICPNQSGPLHGEIQWKNLFGIVKYIPIRSYVFQPFAQFLKSSYEFAPVCVGHVSRQLLNLSWCFSDHENKKKTRLPLEEQGMFEFCLPELVMLNGKPCTVQERSLAKEKCPFRIYPHQGNLTWGTQCSIHVAFAPTQFLADPQQFEKQRSQALETAMASTDIDSKPHPTSGSGKSSASRRLSSAGMGALGNSFKVNSSTQSSTTTTPTSTTTTTTTSSSSSSSVPANGTKSRPISSKSQPSSILNPASTFTQASLSHPSKPFPDSCLFDLPFQSCIEVYRVPIYFSLLQRSQQYGLDHRPSRYLSFIYFKCTTFTTTWKLSTNNLEFPSTPLGFHSLQTLNVTNPHPHQTLTLTYSAPPQSPFVVISALHPIPPKSTLSIRVGFFPTSDQLPVIHRAWLRSGATECGITLKGIGYACPVTLSNDSLDPWVPLQASFGHVCWNEPKTLTWSIHNPGSVPLPTRWRSSQFKTSPSNSSSHTPWLEWTFPDRIPSQSTHTMTFTCSATTVGRCQATMEFFILGLGNRSLELEGHVHRFTPFCEPSLVVRDSTPERSKKDAMSRTSLVPWNSLSETEFEFEIHEPKCEALVLELTHLKPTNFTGMKLDAKKPLVATFTFQYTQAFQLDLSDTNTVNLEMGKSMVVNMKKVLSKVQKDLEKKREEDQEFKIVVTGGLDLISKKVMASGSPLVYHIKWVDE